MKAKVVINVCGRKVREYEIENYKMPDIAGFLKDMKKLGVQVKVPGQKNLRKLIPLEETD